MAERIDVFISSTSRDLMAYRDAIAKVILRLGMYPIDMATFNPTDRNALQLCYDKVNEAEIFIGIYAYRYGYVPGSDVTYTKSQGNTLTGDSETGVTHLEYLWAVERNLPMLLFVISDTNADGEPMAWPVTHIEDEPGKSRLKNFKNLIMGKHVVGFFHSPDHLATQVATGLAELKTKFQSAEEKPTFTATRRDFYKHIQLPPNYVPRTELLAELRLALLGDSNIALTSAVKSVTALHGMGGIGKSVMARALCDDPVVQAAYTDGILWTTLGQEPNLTAKLREWVEALGGTVSENAPSSDSLRANLAGLLENRNCLLIVDDVWQKKHAEAFRVGGEKCRLLLTTRDSETARSLGATIQPIPTMSAVEAIELLKEWADGALKDTDPALLTKIVNKLGRLPLAIKLAGAQLSKKEPEKWLERFDSRKLASKRPEDIHDSLEQTFGLSLETLAEAERKLYAALVIFREDEPIRAAAIRRLWSALDELDEDDADDLLDDLAARALLEVVDNEHPRAAVLHDLLRDFMGAEINDFKIIHQALLDIYHETWTGEGWQTAPDDGYLYEHLTYHLEAVGDYLTIKNLFVDQAWMNVRVPANDWRYDGYLNDLEAYWRDAERRAEGEIASGQAPEAFAECLRCALIQTSVNSLAGNYLPEMVVRAVELGLWSVERALSTANRIPDMESRAKMYISILDTRQLLPIQYQIVTNLALTIVRLIPESSFSFITASPRSNALTALARHLQPNLLDEALAIVRTLADRDRLGRSNALTALALRFATTDHPMILQEAMAAADSIYDVPTRISAISTLIPHLPEKDRSAVLQKALFTAHMASRYATRISAISTLIPHLPEKDRSAVLQKVLTIDRTLLSNEPAYGDGGSERIHVVGELIPYLQDLDKSIILAEMLTAARALPIEFREIRTWSPRSAALLFLIPHIQEADRSKIIAEVLDITYRLKSNEARAFALNRLFPYIQEADRPKILAEALDITRDIKHHKAHTLALSILVPYLPYDMLEQILVTAREIKDNWILANTLSVLVPYFSPDLLVEVLSTVGLIEYEPSRASILTVLVPYLPPDLLTETLVAARSLSKTDVLNHGSPYLQVLSALIPYLPERERLAVMTEALSAISHLYERAQVTILSVLVPYLVPNLLSKALMAINAFEEEDSRANALRSFAPYLPPDLLKEVLISTQAFHSDYNRAIVLNALIPNLREDERPVILEEALVAAYKTPTSAKFGISPREDVLIALIANVPEAKRPTIIDEVLNANGTTDSIEVQISIISALLPYMSESLRSSVLRDALEIVTNDEDDNWPFELLYKLLPHLLETQRRAVLGKLLTTACTTTKEEICAVRLAILLPHLPDRKIDLLAEIRVHMLAYILQIRHEKLETVLKFCQERILFMPPILSESCLSAIGENIIEIGSHWEWL